MRTPNPQTLPKSFATCSIGYKPSHKLPEKLRAISAAGFEGIELSMPDIISYARDLDAEGREPDEQDWDRLVEVGREIRKLVEGMGLKVMMLQPFANFEGWGEGKHKDKREDAFKRAEGWMRIMEAVGTDMLQVGSSDAPEIEGAAVGDMARDLALLADMCDEKGFRVAFENWCWATRARDWRSVWELVRKADRRNLGLCLDTFQSAGGEWADPTTESGMVEVLEGQGRVSRDEVLGNWRKSLRDLASTVPPEKIFLLQISDAYRMDPPLVDKVDEKGLRPRGQWSHDYRPLPFDGGYLPVREFLDAVLDTGFTSWLSVEVFDGKGKEKYDDMGEYAVKAMRSLERLLGD